MIPLARRLAAAAGVLCLSAPLVLGAGAPAAAQDGPANVAGSWRMSCSGKRGERILTLSLQQSGASLSGSFSFRGRSGDVSGQVQGDKVSLKVGRFGFTGALSGGTLSGQTARGRACTATRQ